MIDKPDCTIARREINDEDTLVCTADGNPAKVISKIHQIKQPILIQFVVVVVVVHRL